MAENGELSKSGFNYYQSKAVQNIQDMGDSKSFHCIFKRNGAATPGHLRIPETYEMARELADYIENLGIEEWK